MEDVTGQFTVATNPKHREYDGKVRDLDSKELIIIVLAYGIEHVRIIGTQNQVFFCFRPEDLQPFEDLYYASPRNIRFDAAMLAVANEIWKNAMTSWNSMKRFQLKYQKNA